MAVNTILRDQVKFNDASIPSLASNQNNQRGNNRGGRARGNTHNSHRGIPPNSHRGGHHNANGHGGRPQGNNYGAHRGNNHNSGRGGNHRGNQHNNRGRPSRAEQLTPRLDLIVPGEPVAIDFEGVHRPNEDSWKKSGLGIGTAVTVRREVALNTYAHHPKGVIHFPQSKRFGVTKPDIKPQNGARPVKEVIDDFGAICLKSGVVVCHGAINEIRYLSGGKVQRSDGSLVDIGGFDLTQCHIYDTQKLPEYRDLAKKAGQLPKLKILAKKILDRDIQVNDIHSATEDATATMDLFLARRDDFERLFGPNSNDSDALASSTDALDLDSDDVTTSGEASS